MAMLQWQQFADIRSLAQVGLYGTMAETGPKTEQEQGMRTRLADAETIQTD